MMPERSPDDRDNEVIAAYMRDRGAVRPPDDLLARARAEAERPSRSRVLLGLGRSANRTVSQLAGLAAAIALVVVGAVAISLMPRAEQRPATSVRSTSPSAGTPVTGGVITTPPAGPSPSTPAIATASATSTLGPCAADQLRVRIDAWTVTSASTVMSVAVRNTGSNSCSFGTTTGVVLLDASGNRVAESATPRASQSLERLDAGDELAGIVDWSSVCTPDPTPAALALVGPPDDADMVSADLPRSIRPPDCADHGRTEIASFVALREYLDQTTPGDDRFDAVEDVSLRDDGRTLALTFHGAAPYRKGDRCFTLDYAASVLSTRDELQVGVFSTDAGTPVPAAECAIEGWDREQTLEVALAAPFGGSKVRDLTDDRVQLVALPEGLAQLTALPAGWELRQQDDGGASATGSWSRTYSPFPRPPADGPGALTFVQAFGRHVQGDTFGERRVVLVNGTTAELYRHAETGRLTLSWFLRFDGLMLYANESDFSEEELVRLAESAVLPPD